MKGLLVFLLIIYVHTSWSQSFADPVVVFSDEDVKITTSINVVDLTGDGLEDLLMTSSSLNVFYLKNLGNNQFSAPIVIFDEEVFCERAEAVDIDQDGDLDVLAITSFDGRIVWSVNDGNGGFAVHNDVDVLPLDIIDLELADIDNDGKDEIFVSTYDFSSDYGYISMYSKGQSNVFVRTIISDSISEVKSLILEDFNNDGYKDIMIGTSFIKKFVWRQNLKNGTFGDEKMIADKSVSYADAFDYDQDGNMDLIVSNSFDVFIYRNLGGGVFSESPTNKLDTSTKYLSHGDIDNDGDMDILSGNILDKRLYIYTNLGSEFSETPYTFGGVVGALNYISPIDFDHDGDLDIFTSTSLTNQYLYYENLTIITSITDIEASGIKIWPNPCLSTFHVDTDLTTYNSINIVDLNGVDYDFITNSDGDNSSVDISHLPIGMYYIQLVNDKETVVLPFVKE